MNTTIISHLIKKDWQLNQGPLYAYMLVGLVALWLLTVGGKITFLVGTVLLITAVIVIGAHMVFCTVVNERKNQTLPFIMSLPVSYKEYTMAKILCNVFVTGTAWLILLGAMIAFILTTKELPNGLIPYGTLIMTYLLDIFFLMLCVAMVSESETVCIVVMTVVNVTISIFMIWLGGHPGIKPYIEGEVAVWNSTALTLLGIELFFIFVVMALTFFLQSRKRSFL